ncbi:MAG: helix-turn-helix domain-containing protein [Verrucomicrobiota bacterium]
MPKNPDNRLLQQLTRSKIFQDYERAFSEATQLPLSLRPLEIWNMAQRGKKFENPFCALLATSSRACAACLEIQQQVVESTDNKPQTVTCFAGLSDSAVPVFLGEKVIGYLQTGQVLLRQPSKSQFQKVAKQLIEWGCAVDLTQMEEAYFQSRVLTQQQYQAMVRLLEIFAQHLSTVSNQIAVQEANSEPPIIFRAKEFIEQHKSDPISLSEVARALNVSTFYFCKLFKKATGLNFTEYLSRVRIEKAKNLLLNPNLRVSEIAYEVGFQSLTHFNRVFLRIVGRSPTAYRDSLPA